MKVDEQGSNTSKRRVFISYARDDKYLAELVANRLDQLGLKTMWDQNFKYGQGFHEQIEIYIQHSHVFIPVITASSMESSWVHQEIGYAKARNIPVLPITIGLEPEEWLHGLHAVVLPENKSEQSVILDNSISLEAIELVISRFQASSFTIYECAELAEQRSVKMADYAEGVSRLGGTGMLRQYGGLSSMNIPWQGTYHPIWPKRYGPLFKGENHCELQHNERQALERHVKISGCKLIVSPNFDYSQYGLVARITRIKTLIEFLTQSDNDKTYIAFCQPDKEASSITILGDWFYSESILGNIEAGYRQTIFTRHAPSMQHKIDRFDEKFDYMLEECGWDLQNCREQAIRSLMDLVAKLE